MNRRGAPQVGGLLQVEEQIHGPRLVQPVDRRIWMRGSGQTRIEQGGQKDGLVRHGKKNPNPAVSPLQNIS